VEQALLQTSGYAAVARLGSTVTDIQLFQLKTYEKIIVFPDFDRAGMEGARDIATRCYDAGMRDVSVVIPETLTGDDPGSMSEEVIMEHIRHATPWGKSTGWRMRLAGTRMEA
jgi:DNA primase